MPSPLIERMEALVNDFRRLEQGFAELWDEPGPRRESETDQEARRWAANYSYSLGNFAQQMQGRIADLRRRFEADTTEVASGRYLRRQETEIALKKALAAEASLVAAADALRDCGKTKTATSLQSQTREAWQPVVEALQRELAACERRERE